MKSKEEIFTLITELRDELKSIGFLAEAVSRLKIKLEEGLDEEEYLIESAGLKLQNFYNQ